MKNDSGPWFTKNSSSTIQTSEMVGGIIVNDSLKAHLKYKLDARLERKLDSKLNEQLYSQMSAQVESPLAYKICLSLHSQFHSRLWRPLRLQLEDAT